MAHAHHYEEAIAIPAKIESVFAYVDDHDNLAGHMDRPSMMMAGSRLETRLDEGRGQTIGSHIRMRGRVLGIPIDLDEVVTERVEPTHKAWETVGVPRLIVIGPYEMGFDVNPNANGSMLRVSIDYDLPPKNAWLGRLFGKLYARWCVRQMTGEASHHFARGS